MPYELTPDFLEELFTKHNIDYVVHGDDPCLLPDGTDAYAHAKEMGRFKMVSSCCVSAACGMVLSYTHQPAAGYGSVNLLFGYAMECVLTHVYKVNCSKLEDQSTSRMYLLQVKRTEGVSSTDIVGRMLMLVRTNAQFLEVGQHHTLAVISSVPS